ncbi:PepSY-like domain-containing protein [Myroides sp. LJL119]
MRLSYLVVSAFFSTAILFCSCDNKNKNTLNKADQQELQENSKEFLQGVFPKMLLTDSYLVKKPNYKQTVLSTTLDKQLSVDFNKHGDWTQVKSIDHTAIPDEFLTTQIPLILEYVKTNYPLNFIIEVEKIKNQGYEVELNSQFELIFDHNQKFIGIDLDYDDNEELVDYQTFPKQAKEFLSKDFSQSQVVLAKKETDAKKVSLKAYLSQGYKVEFDKKGNWTQISSKINQAIDLSNIAPEIQNYISLNYPKYIITEIQKDLKDKVYEVELEKSDDYMELVFSLEGNFIKVD